MTKVISFLNPSFRWYYHLRFLAIILLGLAIYGQTFGYHFVFDDNFYMLDNPYIRSFDRVNQLWAILPKTRMVGVYSFALNYQINQLNPAGYHIFNFIVHLLAVLLVWALATKLFKIVGWKGAEELAFIIAVLFLVHPCQTQAVTYISQRFESMATLFYLSSIYAYLCARTSTFSTQRIVLYSSFLGFAVLGILTKEVAATLPFMILALEFLILNKKPLKFQKTASWQPYLLTVILGILFAFLLMKMVRTNFFDLYFHYSTPSESYDGDIITSGKYILTQMRVILTFMRLLIFPINQNVDYDYPLSTGLFDPPLTFGGICLIGIFLLLIIRLRNTRPLISFGLAWVLITFSINTAPRSNVIFEHKLYLISFGFFLAVVCALSEMIKNRKILFGILIVLIALLSLASFKRNQVWKDEFTLWSDVARKSPHKARAYNSLGIFYGTQGDFIQSLSEFDRAIEIKPDYAEGYNNRGRTYMNQGNLPQALADFNKALTLNPAYADAYTNRGNVYDKQGYFKQALSNFNNAIESNPNYPNAYNFRGILYSRQGNVMQALSDYNAAIALNPVYAEAYINRGTCYAQQGDFDQSIIDYSKAIDLNPGFAGGYYNRAVSYFQLKEYHNAWGDVHKTEELGGSINRNFINALARASGR